MGKKENSNFRTRKLKKEIEKGEFKGLIIDRSKTHAEIDSQIDVSAEEFRKLDNSDGIQEEESQFCEGGGDVLSEGGKLDHPHPEMLDR